ncbi:13178_t:CDS:2, partial [Acaulospora colombiana]
MPLTLPGAGSFSFFKSPPLTTTSLIFNDEHNISTLSATTSSSNLNNKTAAATETRDPCNAIPAESRIDNGSIKSEKTSNLLNPVVSAERRARSVDAAINRCRRGSNCSSKASNKKPVWFKTLMHRMQQTFFRFNNESGGQVKVNDDVSSPRPRSSADAVRQEVCNRATDEQENTVLSPDEECIEQEDSDHPMPKPEVLHQAGRFTIVREREDFDTIIFDQCHCLQKPCKYLSSGGVHPPPPLELSSESTPYPSRTRNMNESEGVWNNNNKSHLQPNANIHGRTVSSATTRARKPSIVNMHQEFLPSKRHSSVFVAPTSSSSHHHSSSSRTSISSSHEPHTTISSHSGRKFEVEWYSSSVASSNSSASSEFVSSSPASTISAFSFASSPGTNSYSPATTLSRQRSSTLSSKHGRKFEVTVLSSDND